MPKDMRSPDVIRFFKEMYERESYLRAKWTINHDHMLKNAATLDREPTNYYETDVIRHNMEGGIATISRDNIEAGCNRKKNPLPDSASILTIKDLRHTETIVSTGLGDPKEDPRLVKPDTDLSFEPVMRPVDSKIKRLLYKSKRPCGREYYLKKRAVNIPESRYYFAECTNWDYGWRLGDSQRLMGSEYGRHCLLDRILNNRVGPQPDPPHYKSADIPSGPEKCSYM